MPRFIIQKHDSGSWFYQLLSSNGSILLTGLKHEFNQSCHGEILSVRMNAAYPENYERRVSPGKDHFFVLRSMGSEKIIGVSEMYPHSDGCEQAMALVKKVAGDAVVRG